MGLLAFLRSRTFGAALALGAILGALELTRPKQTVLQEIDARLGWRMLPSQHAYDRHLLTTEDINAFGFRDREWTIEKKPGTTRIAFLGDSMTYGATIALDDTYPRIVERELRARGLDVEVMNFAVQGYTLEQSERNYRENVRPFRPDVVVMPFVDQGVRPMAPASAPPRGDLRPWLLRTAFYHLVLYGLRPMLPPQRLEELGPPAAVRKRMKDLEDENDRLAFKSFDAPFLKWWQRAKQTMETLAREVKEDGAAFVITVLPQRAYVLGGSGFGADDAWKEFPKLHAGSAFAPVTPAVRVVMKPIVDAIAAAPSEAERKKAYGTTDPPNLYQKTDAGHFNEDGMRVIAGALVPALEKVARDRPR